MNSYVNAAGLKIIRHTLRLSAINFSLIHLIFCPLASLVKPFKLPKIWFCCTIQQLSFIRKSRSLQAERPGVDELHSRRMHHKVRNYQQHGGGTHSYSSKDHHTLINFHFTFCHRGALHLGVALDKHTFTPHSTWILLDFPSYSFIWLTKAAKKMHTHKLCSFHFHAMSARVVRVSNARGTKRRQCIASEKLKWYGIWANGREESRQLKS